MGVVVKGVTYTPSDLRVAIDWYEQEIQRKQAVLSQQMQRWVGVEIALDLLKRELRVLNAEYRLLTLELEANVRRMGSELRQAAEQQLQGEPEDGVLHAFVGDDLERARSDKP